MKKGVFVFVVCVILYVQSAPTDSEMVWLKDETTSFETDKRTLSDPDLPDELTFHLSRGSHALTLNLKRNHGIDPNADVYVVRKLDHGGSALEKTRNLEKEAVAYYQDRENGAFMTVKCVKRSNGQCGRVINGNIRIGDRNYDLRPVDTDVTSRNLLDVPDLLGTRYVLHDQANIQRAIAIEKSKDAANVEQELTDLLRRFPHEQDKQNHFSRTNSTLSSRNVAGLHNIGTTDKRDNAKKVYWVKIAVLIDSGVWDLYSSLIQSSHAPVSAAEVKRKIREAYSHIINGVDLLYTSIEDSNIKISVILHEFYIFQAKHDFPHRSSAVKSMEGTLYIECNKYLADLAYWDTSVCSNDERDYDHAMLFTRYDLYDRSIRNNNVFGVTEQGAVCDIGKRISVIEAKDFFLTMSTAAHELGHNLGAVHDGEKDAIDCPAEDSFIMSPITPQFDLDKPYSRNPWMFSNCSVEAFKKTLKDKSCVTNRGVFFNETEWKNYVMKLPGEVYTLDEQCQFIHGQESEFCQNEPADVCLYMQCTDIEMGECIDEYLVAARGTSCGDNMWCIEGKCVSKDSK